MRMTAHRTVISRDPSCTSRIERNRSFSNGNFGIAVVDSGRKVIVTNSNRFGGGANDDQVLTVIDVSQHSGASPAILGTVPAGAFPREMRVSHDGRTLFLTNFNSKTIEMIDLARMPIK